MSFSACHGSGMQNSMLRFHGYHGLLPWNFVITRVHENQSVQLGWVAVTAKFRDYIILVM